MQAFLISWTTPEAFDVWGVRFLDTFLWHRVHYRLELDFSIIIFNLLGATRWSPLVSCRPITTGVSEETAIPNNLFVEEPF